MKANIHIIIEQIYQAALEPSKWPDLLLALTDIVDTFPNKERALTRAEISTLNPFVKNNRADNALTENIKNLPLHETCDNEFRYPGYKDSVSSILINHFRNALEIARKLIQTQQQQDIVLSLLNQLPIGLLVINKYMEVSQANDYAHKIFSNSAMMKIINNKLIINNSDALVQFKASINQIVENDNLCKQSFSVSVKNVAKPSDELFCILSTTNFLENEADTLISLFISARRQQPAPISDNLKELYSLTRREIEIITSLVQGLTINEIAQRDSVSQHTVRNQVKILMSKTSTSRQGELISLILNGPANFLSVDGSGDLGKDASGIYLINESHPLRYYATSDNFKIAYREYGQHDGLPLIYHHSVIGSSAEIPEQADQICNEHGIRLICPERPGYGSTTIPIITNPIHWAKYIIELMDHLKLQSALQCGYAIGGLFACATSSLAPARTEKLLLISFGARPKTKADFAKIQPMYRLNQKLVHALPGVYKYFIPILAKAMRSNRSLLLKKLAEDCAEIDRTFIYSDYFQELLNYTDKHYPQNYAEAINSEVALLISNWTFKLCNIKTETIIWHGLLDKHVPYCLAKKSLDALPNTTTYLLEDVGHFLIFDNWEKILHDCITI